MLQQSLLADSIHVYLCFRQLGLCSFVVHYGNIIKGQKYHSTTVVCSLIKKKQVSKKQTVASPHQFLHINGQETKLNFSFFLPKIISPQ